MTAPIATVPEIRNARGQLVQRAGRAYLTPLPPERSRTWVRDLLAILQHPNVTGRAAGEIEDIPCPS